METRSDGHWEAANVRAVMMWAVLLATILRGQQPTYWNNGAKIPIYGIGISSPLRVVIDSPEIRKLVGEEEKRRGEFESWLRESSTKEEKLSRYQDLIEHPDQVLPGHREFLDAMAKAPAITVPRKTRGKVLQISKARCQPDGTSTVTFIRMVVLGKKPAAGSEVWVCENAYAFGAPRSFSFELSLASRSNRLYFQRVATAPQFTSKVGASLMTPTD